MEWEWAVDEGDPAGVEGRQVGGAFVDCCGN